MQQPTYICPACNMANHPEPPDMESWPDGDGFQDDCAECDAEVWVHIRVTSGNEVRLLAQHATWSRA